jgi:hypothetical protein
MNAAGGSPVLPGTSAPPAGQVHAIRVRRIYEPPLPDGGARVLVDRLWPRGVRKQAAALDLWLMEVALSAPLVSRGRGTAAAKPAPCRRGAGSP